MPISQLETDLRDEIARVLAKAKRWKERGREARGKLREAFLNPASEMVMACETAAGDIRKRDDLAMRLSLRKLRGYNDDD